MLTPNGGFGLPFLKPPKWCEQHRTACRMLLLGLGGLAGTLLTIHGDLRGMQEYYWTYTAPQAGRPGPKPHVLR